MANIPTIPTGAGSASTYLDSTTTTQYDGQTFTLNHYDVNYTENTGYGFEYVKYDATVIKKDTHGSVISETTEERYWYNSGWDIEVGDYYSGGYIYNVSATSLKAYYDCNISTSVEPSGVATVHGGGWVLGGTDCTLSLSYNQTYYEFDGWYENGSKVSSSESYGFNVTGPRSLIAKFVVKEVVQVISGGNGTVSIGSGEAGQFKSEYFAPGTRVTIHAYPDDGYVFNYWWLYDGTLVTTKDYEITVSSDGESGENFYYASFSPACFVTVNVSPQGGGSVIGLSNPYASGSTCTLTAIANPGYSFSHWEDSGGTEISRNPTYSFTVTSDTSLTAVFDDDSSSSSDDSSSDDSSSEEWEEGPLLYDPVTGRLRCDPITGSLRYLKRRIV